MRKNILKYFSIISLLYTSAQAMEESFEGRKVGVYKIYHRSGITQEPGYIDTTGTNKLFLQPADFKPGDPHYQNQLWELINTPESGKYKIYHRWAGTQPAGYLDTTGTNQVFLQPADFKPGDPYYENQLWELIRTPDSGRYKIYHRWAGTQPAGYLDTTGKNELFLQAADFKPGDPYYQNQLWDLLPIIE